MSKFINWYWGIFLYKSKYSFQDFSVIGGKIHLKSSHSVIDNPELVSLVKPPTIIIEKIKKREIVNQYINKFWIFFSCLNITFNIYFK